MTINHLHIATKDMHRSMHFYTRHLNFAKKMDHGEGVFLQDSEGFLLAIDPVEDIPSFPDWFHLGFCMQNKEQVKQIYDSMAAAGVKFAKDYQEYGSEAVAFYAYDPDGYKIEVSWHRE